MIEAGNEADTRKSSIPHAELILFLACVAIAIVPLAFKGTSCGQDFDFHLESWMEAARAWHEGILYPHWVASANYQTGEPRFVFYPPLSWTLGAILGTILPWTWTPVAYTAICLLAMGAAFYKMAREWVPIADAAIGACLYILSPYISFVIYERSALAELLAAIWFPLLVLFALRRRSSIPQLALVIAALWFTNAPAAVMGCYGLAVIALVAAISERRWNLIGRAISAVALGLGLAAVYLIPAIYEQRWVQIDRAIMPGMRIQDSFLFKHTGMVYHDQVLHTASIISVILIAATTLAAILSYRSRKSQPLRLPLLTLTVLIGFLLFPPSNFFWNVTPQLRFLQFPWRWMLVVSLIFPTLAAMGLAPPDSPPFRRNRLLWPCFRALGVLLIAGICATHAWKHFWIFCDEEDNVHAQVSTLHQQGFAGTEEYTPIFTNSGDVQQNLPPIRVVSEPDADQIDSAVDDNPDWQPNIDEIVPASFEIIRWQPEHMTAEIQSPEPGYAVIRLMDYPAWRVQVNAEPAPRPSGGPEGCASGWRGTRARLCGDHRDDGLLTIPIPAGTSTIDIRYSATPDALAGRIGSLISLAIWLLFAAKSRRRRVIMEQNASRNSTERRPAIRG